MKYARRSMQLGSVYFHFSCCDFVRLPMYSMVVCACVCCSVVFSFFFIIIIFIIFAGFSFAFCLCVCSTGNSRTRAHLPCNFFRFFSAVCLSLATLHSTVDMEGIWDTGICLYISMYIFAFLPALNRKLFSSCRCCCCFVCSSSNSSSNGCGTYKYCCHMLYITLPDRPRNEHFFKCMAKKKRMSINK